MKGPRRIAGPGNWADELQAANAAFSAVELELRAAAAEAQGRNLQLAAEIEMAGTRECELSASLDTSQADRAALRHSVNALNIELEQLRAVQQALIEDAAVKQGLSASSMQGLEAERDRAVATSERLQALLDEKGASLQLASEACNAMQVRVDQLELALRDSDHRHAQTQTHLHEQAVRQHGSLADMHKALQAQQVTLSEATGRYELQMQRLSLTLAQKDRSLDDLRAQLDAAASSLAQTQSQLLVQGQESLQASQRHATELAALHDAMRRQRLELDDRAHRREEAIGAQARQREAEQAAVHASGLAELATQLQARQAEWQSVVSALEARLSELREREAHLVAQALESREALVSHLTEHRAALHALGESHALQQRRWLQQQSSAQAGLLDTLQTRLDRDAQVERALREEIAALGQTLAERETPKPQEHADPMPSLLALQQELGLLRQSLEDERQTSKTLMRQLSELMAPPVALAQDHAAVADRPELPPPTPPQFEPAAPAALVEEKTAMTQTRTPDELMGLYDEDFVRQAYLTVLGREPEEAGLQNCLTQLRSGVSKEALLLALAHSPEGRQLGATAAEILALARRAERLRGNRLARALRRLLGLDSEGLARRVDAIDNRLGTALAAVAQQLRAGQPRAEQMAHDLRALDQRLAQQGQQAQAQVEAIKQTLTAQLAEAVMQLSARVAEVDRKVTQLDAALTQLSQATESTIAHIHQAQLVTREEARLTRTVMAGDRSAFPVPADGGASRPQVVDASALTRVREMLLAGREAA